jgi:hypothetical protein
MSLDRAPSQQDIRHQGSFSLVVDTEKLFHAPVLRQIANNWDIGVIGTLQSGRPYPISTGDRFFSTRSFVGIGNESPQRPNVASDGTLNVTNIGGTFQSTLLVGPAGNTVCPACPQTTFYAPAGANSRGPVDSIACKDNNGNVGLCGTGPATNLFTKKIPVDFQFFSGNLARDAGLTSPYKRFDISLIKAIPIPGRETWRVELKVDLINAFNHPLFTQFNGNDTLNALPVSTDPNCTSCLSAVTGHFIGSNGHVLKLQDLRHGVLDSDINNPTFNGVGNPAATDVARIIQLSVRFKF